MESMYTCVWVCVRVGVLLTYLLVYLLGVVTAGICVGCGGGEDHFLYYNFKRQFFL